MHFQIREIKKREYRCMEKFLYEALFVPKGQEAFPKSILNKPEINMYIKDFGKLTDDCCYVAEVNGKIIGAAWVRIIDDYGHVDDDTPSLIVALYKQYRGLGIGTELLTALLKELKDRGYKAVSLSSQKENIACRWYLKLGFKVLYENEEEYIMVKHL